MRVALEHIRLTNIERSVYYDFFVYTTYILVTRRQEIHHKQSEFNTTRYAKVKARALWVWLSTHGYWIPVR